ncbi:MAG: hypothetical protein LBU64_10355 [Planctomycetota bacterium]|nr:hypothetical protein [Planctomycetota bacterium]
MAAGNLPAPSPTPTAQPADETALNRAIQGFRELSERVFPQLPFDVTLWNPIVNPQIGGTIYSFSPNYVIPHHVHFQYNGLSRPAFGKAGKAGLYSAGGFSSVPRQGKGIACAGFHSKIFRLFSVF